jgi:hypothetical protein
VNNGHPPHSSPKTSNTSSASQNPHAAPGSEDDGYSDRAVYDDEPYYSENNPAWATTIKMTRAMQMVTGRATAI